MPSRTRSHDTPPAPPLYVEAWARDLIAAVGRREARRVLAHYKALAADPKVTKHGRAIAAERVIMLKKLI